MRRLSILSVFVVFIDFYNFSCFLLILSVFPFSARTFRHFFRFRGLYVSSRGAAADFFGVVYAFHGHYSLLRSHMRTFSDFKVIFNVFAF